MLSEMPTPGWGALCCPPTALGRMPGTKQFPGSGRCARLTEGPGWTKRDRQTAQGLCSAALQHHLSLCPSWEMLLRISAPECIGTFGVLPELAVDTGLTQQDESPEQVLCSPMLRWGARSRSLQEALWGGSRLGPCRKLCAVAPGRVPGVAPGTRARGHLAGLAVGPVPSEGAG